MVWRTPDRVAYGLSLALMRPKKMISLEIADARNPEWTDEEREKLLHYEMQGQLFDDVEVKKMKRTVQKVPFDFYGYPNFVIDFAVLRDHNNIMTN